MARPTTRVRRFAHAALAVVAAGSITGCGLLPEGATAPETTLAVIVSTLPPSTVPAATPAPTRAPTTVVSTTAPTTTTTTLESTTTTTEPPGADLVLAPQSLGDAVMGADAESVIAYVTALLGPPTADSGWADPFSAFGVCPGTEVRGITWGDLTLLFGDESQFATGRRHFFSYQVGPPFGASLVPAGLATGEGITVGSTVAELRAAYPEVYIFEGDDVFEPYFVVEENFTGYLGGNAGTDVITAIVGGNPCAG